MAGNGTAESQPLRRVPDILQEEGVFPNSIPPTRGPKDFKSAPPEALEELKQLQKDVVVQAHLNRDKELDIPEAHPELLAKIRDGPGTDPSSEIYQGIEDRRRTPGRPFAMGSATNTQDTVFPVERPDADVGSKSGDLVFKDFVKEPESERYRAQWTLYTDSPRTYPKVENGEVFLSSEPTTGNVYTSTPPKNFGPEPIPNPEVCRPQVILGDNHWVDAFFADWNYRPKDCPSVDVLRDRFHSWLDSTMHMCCKVDIYHQAFFDGTAHSDGERSLFLPKIESPALILDLENERNRLHAHETTEGYCYNLQLHMKNNEKTEETKKKKQRRKLTWKLPRQCRLQTPSPQGQTYICVRSRTAIFQDFWRCTIGTSKTRH